jgi:Protein of unknown function (DUF1257)
MSYHLDQRLSRINDKAMLKRALQTLKYTFEEHEKPVSIRGYGNETLRIPCELVVSRDTTRLGAGIGFHQEKDGAFTLVSDSYANKNLTEFIARLKRTYEEEKAIARAHSLGYKVASRGKWVRRDNEEFLQIVVSR